MGEERSSNVSSRLREILSRLAFLFGSFLISIVLLEILLRVTHLFGADTLVTERDPFIGYRYIPGHEYYSARENDHLITGRFNRYGWRDREWTLKKPSGVYRAAILGDSFVESFQVESDRTFLNLTADRMREVSPIPVELMNFGRSGFTQSEEYLVLQRSAARFKPDMVALFFFPENDIADISPKTTTDSMRPYYLLSPTGKLSLDTSFRQTSKYRGHPVTLFLERNSVLAGFLHEKLESARERYFKRVGRDPRYGDGFDRNTHKLEGYITLCTAHPDPQYVSNYKVNKALIKAMSDYCHERGMRFVLVCVDTESYLPSMQNRLTAADATYNPNFYEDDLGRFAHSLGDDFLGLQRPFREEYVRTGKPLHWGRWGHWNYRGHQLVARNFSLKLQSIIADARKLKRTARS